MIESIRTISHVNAQKGPKAWETASDVIHDLYPEPN
jgi:hypothetical protein